MLICLPVLYKWKSKAWMTVHLFTTWFTEYFKPIIEIYCLRKKKIPLKAFLLMDNALAFPGALMEMYKEINIVSMPAITTSILQPMESRSHFDFKVLLKRYMWGYSSLRSSDGSEKILCKTLWIGFTILLAIKNICHSSEEVKISTYTGIWNKLMPIFMDNFAVFRTSVLMWQKSHENQN